jgi:peptide/nickel transport system permease protein
MEDLSYLAILGRIVGQFLPVWIALAITFAVSIAYKRKLGLYGKLFDSPVGMIGFGIVMFWVFTALLADQIVTFDPYGQFSGMKNKPLGTASPIWKRVTTATSSLAATIWRATCSAAW